MSFKGRGEKMMTVTSDAQAQAQLELCLRAAQLKIIAENKAYQARFEADLVAGIKERMRRVRDRK